MGLGTVLRTCLRPVIAPVRAAVERRVAALVDARVSELAGAPTVSDDFLRQHALEQRARLLALVDERSHPNTDALWVHLRDLDNAMLTVKFFGYELARTLAAQLPIPAGLVPQHV